MLLLFTAWPLASHALSLQPLLIPTQIAPDNAVDIVVEANTYVPEFYEGRSEPTAGSQIRLTAISKNSGAKHVWRVNGQTLPESGQTILITAPTTASEILVEVRVVDSLNNPLSTKTEYIPLSKPRITFYEDNPLRGISKIALADGATIVGNEMTLRGEPYFLAVDSLSSGAHGNWTTGKLSNIPFDDWRAITIFRSDTTNTADIILNIRNMQNLADTVIGQIKINL